MRRLGLWHVAVLLAFTATGVLGQEYPNRAIRWIVGAGFVTAGMVLAGATTRAQDPKPGVGDPFPDIPVPATQIDLVKKGGKELSIQDQKGKIVVVAFYPKALTGG